MGTHTDLMQQQPHTYGQILDDPTEVINVQRLIELLRTVGPNLSRVFERSNNEFIHTEKDVWVKFKELNSDDLFTQELLHCCKLKRDMYLSSIEKLREISETLSESLQTQMDANEHEFLRMIVEEDALPNAWFDLLKDADLMAEKMDNGFKELSRFLEESLALFQKCQKKRALFQKQKNEV